jgi:uncharacterized cupredoxin-like copper-binding protein
MSTTEPAQKPGLDEELRDLEATEMRLEKRTVRLESVNLVSAIFAVFAFALAAAALIVALVNENKTPATVVTATPSTTRSAPAAKLPLVAGMPMKNGMSPPTPLSTAPAGTTSMAVAAGDMWLRPHYASIGAGKVKLTVHNTGGMVHEAVLEAEPVQLDKTGVPTENASLGEAPDLAPGQTKSFTARLKPGRYQLFCNRPGHYVSGQHYDFTVTP